MPRLVGTQKVLTAMSGGVDSSVAALLLVQGGYQVEGVFMKNWDDAKDLFGACTWKTDRRDAVAVAAKLGIKLHAISFEKKYEEKVIKYLVKEYKKGNTPNPDVLCNKFIKFGELFKFMRSHGFVRIATGHYARLSDAKDGIHLLRSADQKKDQTYFLNQLSQGQLKKIIFPLGGLTKIQVREIAQKNNLPTANKKESMGVCFVGKMPMKKFLESRIGIKRGPVFLEKKQIGTHDGSFFYTVGQRHGIIGGQNKRLYVIKKNIKENALWVGERNSPLLLPPSIIVKLVNWIPTCPRLPWRGFARIRHGGELHMVIVSGIINKSNEFKVRFIKKPWAPAQGQFCVFYDKKSCIGGGVIK